MRRQTRRVVLGALFALVGFTGSAAAACASWALWDENQVTGVPVDPWSSWAAVQAFPDRVGCEQYAHTWRVRLLTEKQPARTSGEWVELLSPDGKVRSTWRSVCIPDTVDPRSKAAR